MGGVRFRTIDKTDNRILNGDVKQRVYSLLPLPSLPAYKVIKNKCL